MKKIVMSMLIAVAAIFAGCDWIGNATKGITPETYAKMAGKAISTILMTSDKYFTPESKMSFVSTLNNVVDKLPNDISSTNLQAFVERIVDDTLATTIADASKRQAYSDVAKIVYRVIGSGLETLEGKYPAEFANADAAYAIMKVFLTSIRDTFNGVVASEKDPLEYEDVYKDMLEAANKVK